MTGEVCAEASGLEVRVGSSTLISAVDLALYQGEILAVVGENGAGKSTLLRAVAGEQRYTAGRITLFGHDSRHWHGEARARQVAVLPQRSSLNFAFAADEVVAMGRMPHRTGVDVDRTIVADVMDLLDIAYLRGRDYTALSGGEQQRVHLARVLAQIWREDDAGPRLLLLDEPSAALDLGHQQAFATVVRQFANSGVAVLMVVHDLNLAAHCADRVLLMACGRVVTCGAVEEVLTPDTVAQVLRAQVNTVQHPHTGRTFFLW